jgi:tRNA threonylcarbamoyladenosine biosynthesis protein TsaE
MLFFFLPHRNHDFMKKLLSHSEDETLQCARDIGAAAQPGDIFALHGDLGAGKTLFAKGMAQGLDVKELVTSPTFNLLDVHQGRLPFYHFDLYRISSDDEMDQLLFEEYWHGSGVSLIEWAERASDRLPEKTVHITLTYINETTREISIEHPSF